MDGIFIRKKTSTLIILLLLSGIFLIGLYIYWSLVDPEAISGLLTFLIFGILIELVTIPAMLLNHGAYIQVGENTIKAKYHWFGKLNCRIEDVEFVLPQINALTILLKNGKRHAIMGVENSYQLAQAIRRQNFMLETEPADSVRRKFTQAQAARKKALMQTLVPLVLMFAIIFITVALTGSRDLGDFSQTDWIIFGVMGIAELVILVILFLAAERCGKLLLPIEQQKYRVRGALIATTPLPGNTPIAVYTDENYSGRIVVCGYPNSESVYYCVQPFTGSFTLETEETSEIYDSVDDLPDFSDMIDITVHFIVA